MTEDRMPWPLKTQPHLCDSARDERGDARGAREPAPDFRERWRDVARYALVLLATSVAMGCAGDRQVGGECRDDSDCADICIDELPGGHCTLRCRDNRDCPGGTICVDTEGGVCLFECDSRDECSDRLGGGYVCGEETDFDDREVRVCTD